MKKLVSMVLCLLMILSFAAAENTGFAMLEKLYSPDKNTVFSPVSMHIALNMAAEGASGITKDEILALTDDLSSDEIHSANALFVSDGIKLKKAYKKVIDEKFAAEYFSIDDKIVSKVNRWVEKQTNGMIENFMQQKPAADTGLILINAVAMEKNWRKPFDEADTRPEDFFAPAQTVQTEMMHQTDNFRYAEIDGVQVICLPYANSSLEMWIAMPAADEMEMLLGNLRAGGMEYLFEGASMREVVLSLPKASFSDENDLTDALKDLGVNAAFAETADFSDISDTPMRVVSVRQKAKIEMNEKSTKAAAVTEVAMLAMGAAPGSKPEPVIMTVNRPYFFAVYDADTSAVCFCGTVMNPLT